MTTALTRTDAEAKAFFARLMVYFRAWSEVDMLERRMRGKAVRVVVDGDEGGKVTYVELKGFDLIAATPSGADEDGIAYLTITDGGGGTGHTVSVFSDSGKTNKICEGTGNDNSEITMTAESGETVSGVIGIGAISGSLTDIRFFILSDFGLQHRNAFDFSQDGDEEELNSAPWTTVANRIRRAKETLRARIDSYMLGAFQRFIGQEEGSIFQALTDENNDVYTLDEKGAVEALRVWMGNNSNTQSIRQSNPSAGAATAHGSNVGQGAMGAPTVTERAIHGDLVFTCITNYADSNGAEEFRARLIPKDRDIVDGNHLTTPETLIVTKSWASARFGVSAAVLTRSGTMTNVSGTGFDTTFADHTITGENPTDAPGGKVYLRWDSADGGTIRAYSSQADRDTGGDLSTMIGGVTSAASGTGTHTLTAQNNATISLSIKLASPTNGNTADLDLKVFSEDDEFTVIITVPKIFGDIQELIKLIWGHYLRSAASSEEIADGLVRRGSMFRLVYPRHRNSEV